jgi:hypothetical protein
VTDRSDHPHSQPSPAPQHSVVDTPATVQACENDYAARNTAPPAGQHSATPHTHGRS